MADEERDDETVEDVVEQETAPKPRHHAQHDEPAKGFVHRAWGWQHAIDRRWDSMGRGRIARVLRMARKPEPEEFRQSAFIVLVGIAVIGGIGFFMFLLMENLLKWLDTFVQ